MNTLNVNRDIDYKSLALIEDTLQNELLLYKKYKNYSTLCFDSELINICLKCSLKHKDNYKKLTSYLKNGKTKCT